MESKKMRQLKEMSKEERGKKLKELRLELIKSGASSSKTGSTKIREIKKTIARISMLNKSDKDGLKNK